jgi:hypothetical protein
MEALHLAAREYATPKDNDTPALIRAEQEALNAAILAVYPDFTPQETATVRAYVGDGYEVSRGVQVVQGERMAVDAMEVWISTKPQREQVWWRVLEAAQGEGWDTDAAARAADRAQEIHDAGSRAVYRRGDWVVFRNVTGRRLYQDRPLRCRDAGKCVCGNACSGTVTLSPEYLTDVVHWVSGGIDIEGHRGSRLTVRPDRLD